MMCIKGQWFLDDILAVSYDEVSVTKQGEVRQHPLTLKGVRIINAWSTYWFGG